MKKRVRSKKLGRSPAQRKALYRSLISALIKHGRIRTTLAKAKALRPQAEKLITKARRKKGASLAQKLLDEIAPRYQNRPGGYLRIIKLGPRQGDGAEMAQVELVGAEKEDESKNNPAPKN